MEDKTKHLNLQFFHHSQELVTLVLHIPPGVAIEHSNIWSFDKCSTFVWCYWNLYRGIQHHKISVGLIVVDILLNFSSIVFSVAQVDGGVHEDLQLDLHDAPHLPLVWMPSGHHDDHDGGDGDNDGLHDHNGCDDDEDVLRSDTLGQLLKF